MPVHKWLLRHVYYPCMRLGMGKWWAGTVVFAISAAFHELLIGLPLHMVKLWAFVGLMFQARLFWLLDARRPLLRAGAAVQTSRTWWTWLKDMLPAELRGFSLWQTDNIACLVCLLSFLLAQPATRIR